MQWFFLPTPGSLPTFPPEKFPCGYHNYILSLPVICCSLLVRMYRTHRAIIRANPWLTLSLFLSFPVLLLRKRLLLCAQPCRWLAPPLGQLQLALQGESCLCSGFYFHFGEIKPECFVASMDLRYRHISIVTLTCLKSRRKESFHSIHSYNEKLLNIS